MRTTTIATGLLGALIACAAGACNGRVDGGEGSLADAAADNASAGADASLGDADEEFSDVKEPDVEVHFVDGGTACFADAAADADRYDYSCCNDTICGGRCALVNGMSTECWCAGIVGGCGDGQTCCPLKGCVATSIDPCGGH